MFEHGPAYVGDKVTVEYEGFTLEASLEYDHHHEAPWEAEDGHGPVTGWERRDKAPGEMVLSEGRHGLERFYDFQQAVKIAKREGWRVTGDNDLTPKARAANAALADFYRLRDWCNDEWCYVGVVVTASREGLELGSASLWGIESDAGDYLTEIANELIDEAMEEAKATISRLCSA